MKFVELFSALVLSAAVGANAQSQSVGFTNVVNSPIPDANPNGLMSTIDVSGVFGSITNVTVFLNTTGQWNGDLYGYLASDNGGFAVLLNRAGKSESNPPGYGDAGFSITLDDAAPVDIHLYGGNNDNAVTGLWQPDGRHVDPQLTLDTDSRTAMLQSFNGLNPNGTWTLFLADMAVGYDNSLISWGFEFQTIPEPSSGALLAGAAVLFAVMRWRKR